MKLTIVIKKTIQKGQTPVNLILEKKGRREVVALEKVDQILERLDKLLKKNKISVKAIGSIKVIDNFLETSHTSRRIIKSVKKALKIGPLHNC